MNKIKVEMIQEWQGVTFHWTPGQIVDMNPGDAERLIAGGVCKPVETPQPTRAKPKKEE